MDTKQETQLTFYTVAEVANLLRISERHARRLLDQGELRGFKIGMQWRVPRPEIDRLITTPDMETRP